MIRYTRARDTTHEEIFEYGSLDSYDVRYHFAHRGRVLQIGTPEEIYEHPSARFVADFIGETNLIAATRTAAARYRLASGIEVDASEDAASREVTLAIRPERIEISKEGLGQLRCTVDQIIFEGTDTTYHLVLPGGSRLRVCVQNRERARKRFFRGETVSARLPPDAIRVLTE